MPHYLTSEGREELAQELAMLKVKREDLSRRIQEAKGLGDLSENADYADAKDAQAFNEGRIAELEEILLNVELIPKSGGGDVVRVGSTVTVESDDSQRQIFLITGASEANPAVGKISNESPLGRSLLGKTNGENVAVETPAGTILYRIRNVA